MPLENQLNDIFNCDILIYSNIKNNNKQHCLIQNYFMSIAFQYWHEYWIAFSIVISPFIINLVKALCLKSVFHQRIILDSFMNNLTLQPISFDFFSYTKLSYINVNECSILKIWDKTKQKRNTLYAPLVIVNWILMPRSHQTRLQYVLPRSNTNYRTG